MKNAMILVMMGFIGCNNFNPNNIENNTQFNQQVISDKKDKKDKKDMNMTMEDMASNIQDEGVSNTNVDASVVTNDMSVTDSASVLDTNTSVDMAIVEDLHPIDSNNSNIDLGPQQVCLTVDTMGVDQHFVVNGLTINVYHWLSRTFDPGYCGFNLAIYGPFSAVLNYTINLNGADSVISSDLHGWQNPNGTISPSVKAITSIVLCVTN